ncbi:MAG: hypothetical protein NZO58_12670 [Gemmataceae bacterium]|nr:hypothetical protein [Gemmataceae bacterium]
MKRDNAELLLTSLIALLCLLAGGLVVFDAGRSATTHDNVAAYQRLVGGLGLGPAVDWSRCPTAFDPRLCPTCPWDDGPIAGAMPWCPCHGCSLFDTRGLPCGLGWRLPEAD